MFYKPKTTNTKELEDDAQHAQVETFYDNVCQCALCEARRHAVPNNDIILQGDGDDEGQIFGSDQPVVQGAKSIDTKEDPNIALIKSEETATNQIIKFRDHAYTDPDQDGDVIVSDTAGWDGAQGYPAILPPEAMVSRVIEVGRFQWDSTHMRDAVIATLDFPEVLFQSGFIRNHLEGYLGFQGAIEIEIRTNTTQFTSGAYMAVLVPTPTISNRGPPPHAIACSTWPGIVGVAGADNVEKLTIPFIWPNSVFPLEQALADFDTAIPNGLHRALARLKIIVLDPLQSSSSTTPMPVTINVMAQLKNVALYIPSVHSGVVLQGKKGKAFEEEEENDGGSLSQVYNDIHLQGIPDSEAESVAQSGEEITKGSSSFDKIMSAFPVSTGMIAAAALGLQKPISTAATEVVNPKYAEHLTRSVGTIPADTLNSANVAYRSSDTSYSRTQEITTVQQMLSIPCISTWFTLNSTTQEHSWPLVPTLSPTINGVVYPTIGDTTLSNFVANRCSINMTLFFPAAQQVTARIMLTLHVHNTTGEAYEHYSQIININGPTHVSLFFPYMELEPFKKYYPHGTGGSSYVLNAKLLSNVNTPGNTSYNLNCYVYQACGEDSQVYGVFPAQALVPQHQHTDPSVTLQHQSTSGETVTKQVDISQMSMSQSRTRSACGDTKVIASREVHYVPRKEQLERLADDIDTSRHCESTESDIHLEFSPREMFATGDFKPFMEGGCYSSVQGVVGGPGVVTVKDALGYSSPWYTESIYRAPTSFGASYCGFHLPGHIVHFNRTSLRCVDPTTGTAVYDYPLSSLRSFAGMFLYFAGSTEYTVCSFPPSGTVLSASMYYGTLDQHIPSGNEPGAVSAGTPMAVTDTAFKGNLPISVPFTTPVKMLPVRPHHMQLKQIVTDIAPYVSIGTNTTQTQINGVDKAYVELMVYGTVGDDFAFSYIVGPGPCVRQDERYLALGPQSTLKTTDVSFAPSGPTP